MSYKSNQLSFYLNFTVGRLFCNFFKKTLLIWNNLFIQATPVSLEGRPQLKLLPRTVPVAANVPAEPEGSSKASSIFGTGKARDITKPEIKELEERLEQSLILSKKQAEEAAAAAAALAQSGSKLNSSSNSDNGSVHQNERPRTTSTASSNNSNRK